MSLSAGRDLQPLAYSCLPRSGKLAGHRNVNTDGHSTLQDAANKGKPLLVPPRRRRELEIEELEAEHRAETWTKVADETDERVQTEAHAKIEAIEADDAGSQIDVVNNNYDADEREIAEDTSTLEAKEMKTENLGVANEGKERELLSEQDEEREMTDIISNDKQEEEATGQKEKPVKMDRDEATKITEKTYEDGEHICVEDELHTPIAVSTSSLPTGTGTLLSKVFDDDGAVASQYYVATCRPS